MKFKIVILFVVIVVLIAVGIFVWKFYFPQDHSVADQGTGFLQDIEEMEVFEELENGFSFSYPKNLRVIETALEGVEGGKRILVENMLPRQGLGNFGDSDVVESEQGEGFEIIVLPFDEVGPLTTERILADIPDMVMENVKNILVGNNIGALSFDSIDENIGKTFEIWFVSGGYLYQARTYSEFGEEMEKILNTWNIK